MEWLKTLLEGAKINDGKLDVDSLVATINKEFPKHAIPKATFNATNEELKTANATIKTLKADGTSSEELQKTIKKYEDDTQILKSNHLKEVKDLKVNTAISNILSKNKAVHPDLLSKQFKREDIKINDDGTITGIEEQFTGIKEKYGDQFKNEADTSGGQQKHYYEPKGSNAGESQGATSFLDIIKENQVRK